MPTTIIHFEYFSHFDYVVLSINLLIFIFSKLIIDGFGKSDKSSGSSKLYALRAIIA
ncbi:MAG: hypothetical protein O7D86_10205 [Proteobacteria bacterium]|nr:hypothetical protein [Pseudomonadota bacterium]